MSSEWFKTADRLPTAADSPTGPTKKDGWGREVPIEYVPCLVVTHDAPTRPMIRLWNLPMQCWDDEAGDDFWAAALFPLAWIPLPVPRFKD